LTSRLLAELVPVSSGTYELPEAIGIEMPRLMELVYKLCYTMVRLEGGKLPNVGKGAVEAAFL
jgi:hypothetical protein